MRLCDFDYDLPRELIATRPPARRADARLLVVPPQPEAPLRHLQFPDLWHELRPEDLLIFNNTRVFHAQLQGRKATGGKVQLLVVRCPSPSEIWAWVKASHPPQIGSRLELLSGPHSEAPSVQAEVVEKSQGLVRFLLKSLTIPVGEWLEKHGSLPLPPYLQRESDLEDEKRYQTLFAGPVGALAAPTAGLHFDEAFFEKLKQHRRAYAWVTLHVGLGTFAPVRCESIEAHVMHEEFFNTPSATVEAIAQCRARGGSVVAVGTTSLRAIESAYDLQRQRLVAQSGMTRLFVTPGYRFHVVDRLVTNFHQPQSTLMMLVSAFVGHERCKKIYQAARQARYRFLSYGDAMLLTRSQEGVL